MLILRAANRQSKKGICSKRVAKSVAWRKACKDFHSGLSGWYRCAFAAGLCFFTLFAGDVVCDVGSKDRNSGLKQ